jgi:RNA polymerase sigma factor (sigma-70 family)
MFSRARTRWIVRIDGARGQGPLSAKRGHYRKQANLEVPASVGGSSSLKIRGDDPQLSEVHGPTRRRTPLTEDQRTLAVNYLPMARQLAQRLSTTWPTHPDELQSTAYMALVEAAQTFDPTRNVGFGTYARHRIRGAIRDFQRLIYSGGSRAARAQRPVFQVLRKFDEDNGEVLGIEPEPPVGTWLEATEAVEYWLKRLPKAHAVACRLIYIHGKSQDQVASEVGCSKSYLSRLHREAITWLIRDYHETRANRAEDSCQVTD